MDRREFVETTTLALLAVGGMGGCAARASVPVEVRDGRIRLQLGEHPELDAPGGHIRIRPAGHPHHLLVFALPGDEFAAVSPVCTHRQCIVDVSGTRVVCPCHGSEYDRTGRVLAGPAERPLTRYPVERKPAGELVIRWRASGSR